MKRALLPPLALWLLLAGGCSALPTAREMGDMALLRTMGVDREGGEMAVTASTGPRGLQGEGLPALVLSTRGDTLSGACMAMQGLSDSYVFFGYVDQLLVGEEAARAGLAASAIAMEGAETINPEMSAAALRRRLDLLPPAGPSEGRDAL